MLSLKRIGQGAVASLMAAFFILPISTYAVDIDSSRFIVRSPHVAEPDAQSGAFTQFYGFSLPPGRNGVQPSLALSYNSTQATNGSVVGHGWSLAIPSIRRLSPHGSDELYERNDFTSTLSGELSEITLTDGSHGTYGAKVDDGSYLSYTYNTDESWTVTDKAGVTYTFGNSTMAQVVNPDDSTQVYEWMLTRIEDALGNAVTYTYEKDGNQIYPETINYTGFETTPGIFDVVFSLEERDDVFTTYAPGFAVTTSYRISDVVVKVDNQPVREYALEYSVGDNGVRSMLSSITETATTEDGASSLVREETAFSYADGNESWSSATVDFPGAIAGVAGSLGVYLFDMDGDAISDVIESRPVTQQISLGNGDGTWELSSALPPIEFALSSGADKGVRVMDVDGDGALDVVYSRILRDTVYDAVYINNGDGTGWTEDTAYSVPIGFTYESGSNMGVEIFDADGDGLPDIVKSRDGSTPEVYINDGDGTGWTLDTGYTVPIYFAGSAGADVGVRIFDVNGDGLADIAHSREYNNEVYLNNGDGTGWTEDTAWSVPVYFTGSGYDMGVRPMDVNGDGLTDLVYHRADGGSFEDQGIYMNTGSGWVTTSLTTPLPFNLTSGADLGVRIEDIDGDGLADILRSRNIGSTTYNNLYLADGEVADLMTSVTTSQGAQSEVTYTSSANGENPNLPFALQVTQSITTHDGIGNTSTKTYTYTDGDYFYENQFNRGFAGFGTVTVSDEAGSTISYFSQGNDANTALGEQTDSEAQIGKRYRTERTDEAGHVYQTQIDTWEVTNIGTNRDFVLQAQTLELLYGSGSSHVDRATAYDYDAVGNVITQVEFGSVNGSDSGSFADIGTDKRSTEWEYATFSSTGAVSSYKKIERLKNYSSTSKRVSRWFYDGLPLGSVDEGLVTKVNQNVSPTASYGTAMTYDSHGLLATVTDAEDYITTYTQDSHNLYPAIITNALSQTTEYTYDYSSGGVVATTDENGTVRASEYDAFDRPIEITVDGEVVTTYTYNESIVPNQTHKTDWFDTTTARETYMYSDGFGRQVQIRAEAEDTGMYYVIDTGYDELGREYIQSLPYEDSGSAYTSPTTVSDLLTTTTFDTLNRPLSTTNVTGTATTSYAGRQQTETKVNGNITLRTFDAFDRLISVGEKDGTSVRTTSYTYTPADELASVTDPAGNIRNFTYDQRGARLTATDLHASADAAYGTWTYTYNTRGLMASEISPDAITKNYTYDGLGRKTAEDVTTSSGTDITYTYDSCTNGIGRVCTVEVLGGSTTEYEYDELGSVSTEDKLILGTNYVTSYTHDLQGGVASITYPDASVATNVLDVNGSLDEVSFVDGRTSASTTAISNITYGPHGKPTEITYGNGVVTSYTYDDAELYRLSDLVTMSGSTVLQDFSYNYDSIGNISTLTDTSDLYADMTTAYTYNKRNLLTRAAVTSSDPTLTYTKNWTYGSIGNIATSTDCGTHTYGGRAPANYANPHAVTQACGKSYTYNRSGSLVADGTFTYHVTPLGLVGEVKNSGTTVTTFAYDESGNRVSKVSVAHGITITPNSYYTLDGTTYERNILAGDLGSVATSTYDTATSTASVIYHHKDHLGGTHVESDSSGSSVQYILYTPFGGTLVDVKTGSHDNDHKYTDKEKDEDTGLYYYGARYYNPEAGVFTSQDPVYLALGTGSLGILNDPQSLNSYSYARNNPIANNDPTGEFWNFVLGAVATVWNTVVDPVLTTFSVVQAVQSPSPTNIGAAAVDTAMLLSPLPAGAGLAANIAQTGSVAKTAENVVSSVSTSAEQMARMARRTMLNAQRRSAVRQAWKAEREVLMNGGDTSYRWSPEQARELIETGRVKGFEGHHINSVSGNPEMAGDPRNIEFVNGKGEHLKRHDGNWQNETSGDLIDR